jgi:hypothetical protein
MVIKNKELVIKGITEQQLRAIIQDELGKLKLEMAEMLIAASGVFKPSEKSAFEQFQEFKYKLHNDPSYKWLADALEELKFG